MAVNCTEDVGQHDRAPSFDERHGRVGLLRDDFVVVENGFMGPPPAAHELAPNDRQRESCKPDPRTSGSPGLVQGASRVRGFGPAPTVMLPRASFHSR